MKSAIKGRCVTSDARPAGRPTRDQLRPARNAANRWRPAQRPHLHAPPPRSREDRWSARSAGSPFRREAGSAAFAGRPCALRRPPRRGPWSGLPRQPRPCLSLRFESRPRRSPRPNLRKSLRRRPLHPNRRLWQSRRLWRNSRSLCAFPPRRPRPPARHHRRLLQRLPRLLPPPMARSCSPACMHPRSRPASRK